MTSSDTTIAEVTTEYGTYRIVDTIYNSRPARVLYASDDLSGQSGIALDDGPGMLFEYNERFMELVRGLQPKSVLLIGGGALTLPRAIQREFPDIHLTIVEIDAQLIDVAPEYFDFTPNKNATIVVNDGAHYLAETNDRYDLLLLDVFFMTSVPRQFQTNEVCQQLQRHLQPNGICAMNIIASYYGQRSELLQRQIRAFQTTCVDVQLYLAESQISSWLPQNFILIGQNRQRDLRPLLRYERMRLPTS